jgi:shikimate 5-dehydrogenase
MTVCSSTFSRPAKTSMSTQPEQQDWLNLSARVAVVTGAGSGIGAAIANGFAKAGAKVAVVDRDGEAAANVAARLAAAGGTATAFTCDVTRQDAVNAVADKVTARKQRRHSSRRTTGDCLSREVERSPRGESNRLSDCRAGFRS